MAWNGSKATGKAGTDPKKPNKIRLFVWPVSISIKCPVDFNDVIVIQYPYLTGKKGFV
jgi:hypothetical protein